MTCRFQNYQGSQVYNYFLFKEKGMKFPLMMFKYPAILVACMKKNGMLVWLKKFSVEESDVLVKLLHPNCPSVYLHLPTTKDKFWVQVEHIVQLLSIPSVNTSGCHYTFIERILKDTQEQFVENI